MIINSKLVRVVPLVICGFTIGCGTAQGKPQTLAERNLIYANEFLEYKQNQSDVIKTSSGLLYKKIRSGNGCHPGQDTQVSVHYESSLVGATSAFDSSYKRNQQASFTLEKVIPAWREGIPLMKEGDIWEFYVSPKLAYGERGSPPIIGPNVVTIYTVELIKATSCR